MNKDELKKIEMKKDGKGFERFDNLFRHVVSVPKEEINKREEAEKHKKEAKKKG
jgi:hypothetical protein